MFILMGSMCIYELLYQRICVKLVLLINCKIFSCAESVCCFSKVIWPCKNVYALNYCSIKCLVQSCLETQHFGGGTQHFYGEAHSDTACPWCQLTQSISCYQLYFMSLLFAFFSNAHLNEDFPLSSLSNALIREIRGHLKIHLSF